jgi:hypothetical protein
MALSEKEVRYDVAEETRMRHDMAKVVTERPRRGHGKKKQEMGSLSSRE